MRTERSSGEGSTAEGCSAPVLAGSTNWVDCAKLQKDAEIFLRHSSSMIFPSYFCSTTFWGLLYFGMCFCEMVQWRKISQTGNCPPISANHVHDKWGYNCVLPNSKSHFLHFSSTMFHCDFSNLLSCYPLVISITYLWKVAPCTCDFPPEMGDLP